MSTNPDEPAHVYGACNDVVNECDEEEIPCTVKCPQGCPLKVFTTKTSSYECDICGKKVTAGTQMCGCEKCNWNACEQCSFKKIEFVFYYNPLCPYANRAWIAAKEKSLTYDQQIIPLSGEIKMAKDNFDNWKSSSKQWSASDITLEELEQKKKEYKENINPAGTIPTVVHGERKIFESHLIVRYLDETWPKSGLQLTPDGAYDRYRIRFILKHLSSNIKDFFAALKNQDPTKDEECRTKIYSFFEIFVKHADKDGPFFLGKQFSILEVMMFPFYDRARCLLPAYRGFEYIPTDDETYPWAARMKKWSDATDERKSCKETSLGKDKYIAIFDTMAVAGERGKSQFGQ